MSLEVVLGIIIKLYAGRSWMTVGDRSRERRFLFTCLNDAEEIFHEQSHSMLTVHIGQRELSPELIAGILLDREHSAVAASSQNAATLTLRILCSPDPRL